MPQAAVPIIGGVATGLIGASASRSASRAQVGAAEDQTELAAGIYNDTSQNFAPFLRSGRRGQNALMFELGLGDRPRGYQGYELSPYGNALLDQGVANIDASAARRGQLFSGSTLEALEDTRANIVAGDRDNFLNRLAGVASQGQAAAGQQAGAGQAYVQAGSNALANIGNARAAGAVGTANALTQGINTGLEFYNYQRNINPLSTLGTY